MAGRQDQLCGVPASVLNRAHVIGWALLLTLTSGCKNSTIIDEYRENPSTVMIEGESIVVLGRRNSASYETEFDFVDCVGQALKARLRGVNIIPEREFLDSMYPYFEASTAPMTYRTSTR